MDNELTQELKQMRLRLKEMCSDLPFDPYDDNNLRTYLQDAQTRLYIAAGLAAGYTVRGEVDKNLYTNEAFYRWMNTPETEEA